MTRHVVHLTLALAAAALLAAAAAGPERWDGAMKRFDRLDQESPPPAGPVLFVGSSSIVFWNLPESFPGLPVLNRGFGGSTMAELLHHFDRVVRPYNPRVIVLYSGDNDIQFGTAPEVVAGHYGEFIDRVRGLWPALPVVVLGIKPSVSRWSKWEAMREVNRLVAERCGADPLCDFVDTAPLMLGEDGKPDPALYKPDELHVNEAAYAKWAAAVAPFITGPEAAPVAAAE